EMPVVVVGSQHINLVPVLLDERWKEWLDHLGWRGAGAKRHPLTDTAFVVRVVEVEVIGTGQYRPHDFPRGAGQAAEDNVHVLSKGHLPGVLSKELVGRLGIAMHQLQFTAEQPARGV